MPTFKPQQKWIEIDEKKYEFKQMVIAGLMTQDQLQGQFQLFHR